MYTIEIHYRTGNSFGSGECTECVGGAWDNIEDAKLVLSYIKEHWELYKLSHGYRWKSADKIKKEIQKAYDERPWFYFDAKKGSGDRLDSRGFWTQVIKVPDNKGGTANMSVFWTGYFEHLYSAKVVSEGDSELFFET